MSKHRRKRIDPRGHVECPGPIPAAIACKNRHCLETRLKSQPWARECAAAKKAEAA